jgi:NitT/TauT family transport system substrate-binding protein
MMPSRRAVLTAALATLATAGCARIAPQPTPTEGVGKKAVVGLTYIPNVQFAPFYVAESEGLLDAAGAELRHHGAQEGLFTALMADQEQFVIAGGDEVVQAAASGMDLVAVAQYYRRYPVVLIVPEPSPIRTMADLAGHSVGLPGKFGESWFGLQAGMSLAGLTEDDVSIEEVGYTLQAALTSGRVDSVIGFANNDLITLQRGGVPVRAVPLSDETPPLVSIVLVTRSETLQKQPELVRRVADAMVSGVEKTVADPAAALDATRTHVPDLDAEMDHAQAVLSATTELWTDPEGRVSGALDERLWGEMVDFMLTQRIIEQPVNVGDVMTNEFVQS